MKFLKIFLKNQCHENETNKLKNDTLKILPNHRKNQRKFFFVIKLIKW